MIEVQSTLWETFPRVARRHSFAIGDVHGEADLLKALHRTIETELDGSTSPNALLVHLGDLADRGPQSLESIRTAMRGPNAANIDKIDSLGNHDQFLLKFLFGPENERCGLAYVWMKPRNGGNTFATELGIDPSTVISNPNVMHQALCDALGPDGLRYLQNMPIFHREDDLLFVHAGIHPAIPYAEFLNSDRMEFPTTKENLHPCWIREKFIYYDGNFDENLYVIHGHTIERTIGPRHNRFGIDSGAFAGGGLTMLEINEDQYRIHNANYVPQDSSETTE
jgi:serine/threonine protein phosphatase 1